MKALALLLLLTGNALAEEAPTAQQLYDASVVGFARQEYDVRNTAVTIHTSRIVPVRGLRENQVELSWGDFFRAVDEPKLARQYERADAGRAAVGVPGAIMVLTGGILFAVGLANGGNRMGPFTSEDLGYVGGGVATLAVGIALCGAITAFTPPSTEGKLVAPLANRKNEQLRRFYGIP